jgi:hypothetical protein
VGGPFGILSFVPLEVAEIALGSFLSFVSIERGNRKRRNVESSCDEWQAALNDLFNLVSYPFLSVRCSWRPYSSSERQSKGKTKQKKNILSYSPARIFITYLSSALPCDRNPTRVTESISISHSGGRTKQQRGRRGRVQGDGGTPEEKEKKRISFASNSESYSILLFGGAHRWLSVCQKKLIVTLLDDCFLFAQ